MDATINGYAVAIPDPPTGPISYGGREWWAVEYRVAREGDGYVSLFEQVIFFVANGNGPATPRWIMAHAPAPPEGWRVVGPCQDPENYDLYGCEHKTAAYSVTVPVDGRCWLLERIPPPPRVRRVVEYREWLIGDDPTDCVRFTVSFGPDHTTFSATRHERTEPVLPPDAEVVEARCKCVMFGSGAFAYAESLTPTGSVSWFPRSTRAAAEADLTAVREAFELLCTRDRKRVEWVTDAEGGAE